MGSPVVWDCPRDRHLRTGGYLFYTIFLKCLMIKT